MAVKPTWAWRCGTDRARHDRERRSPRCSIETGHIDLHRADEDVFHAPDVGDLADFLSSTTTDVRQRVEDPSTITSPKCGTTDVLIAHPLAPCG
jgi:hypothetical protein